MNVELAPKSLTASIIRFAGRNSAGLPVWRVVLAQSVTRRTDARMPIWPSGSNTDTSEFVRVKGGWMKIPRNVAPERWQAGPHYIPKYPCKGWILERWMPPHIFGDKLTWESHKDAWGDPIMGEFPSAGDYWMLDGPWERIPPISVIEASIASTERDRNNRPKFFEFTLKQMLKDQEDEEAAAFAKWEAELAKYCKSEINPLFKSTSLEAQRVRNEVQASLGQSSHLGAGQQ